MGPRARAADATLGRVPHLPLFPSTSRAGLVLGCMNFGKRTPAAEAERIVQRAIERGVTAFDTANAYNDGESERILEIGRAHV